MSQVRGLASGVAATANWVANAAVSQTFLALTASLGGSGTFWLYAGVALAGMAWVFVVLPETKGALSAVKELTKCLNIIVSLLLMVKKNWRLHHCVAALLNWTVCWIVVRI